MRSDRWSRVRNVLLRSCCLSVWSSVALAPTPPAANKPHRVGHWVLARPEVSAAVVVGQAVEVLLEGHADGTREGNLLLGELFLGGLGHLRAVRRYVLWEYGESVVLWAHCSVVLREYGMRSV